MPTPDSGSAPPSSPGLLGSLKAHLATWVDLLKTRLELFSIELQEERVRLEQIVIWAAAAFLSFLLGLLLVLLLLIAAFWDTEYRLLVVGGLALLFLGTGTALALAARRKIRNRPRLLSATLSELAKDYKRLSP